MHGLSHIYADILRHESSVVNLFRRVIQGKKIEKKIINVL